MLRAIIGRLPEGIEAGRSRASSPCRPIPTTCSTGSSVRAPTTSTSGSPSKNFEIATLQIDKAKAGHYPTLDLVASYDYVELPRAQRSTSASPTIRQQGTIGVQVAGPDLPGRLRRLDRCARRSRCRTRRGRTSSSRGARRSRWRRPATPASSARSRRSRRSSRRSCRPSRRTSRTCSARKSACARSSTCCNVQQNVYSTRRDLAQAYFNYLIGGLRLKAAIGIADRHRPRGRQPPAARLDVHRERCRQACGASHAHRRSAAPRCAAWNASAASRIRSRRAGSASSAAAASTIAGASATSSAAPAAMRVPCRFGEVEHVRPDERRTARRDRLDQVLAAERQQAAADERDVGRRVVRDELAHRIAEHDVRRPLGTGALLAAPGRTRIRAPRSSSATASKRCGWRGTMTRECAAGQRPRDAARRRSALPRPRASTRRRRSGAPRRTAPRRSRRARLRVGEAPRDRT